MLQPPESDSPTVPRRGAAAAPAAKLASGKVCSVQAAVWYRCCRPGSPAATPYGWSAHRLLVTVPFMIPMTVSHFRSRLT